MIESENDERIDKNKCRQSKIQYFLLTWTDHEKHVKQSFLSYREWKICSQSIQPWFYPKNDAIRKTMLI